MGQLPTVSLVLLHIIVDLRLVIVVVVIGAI